MFITGDNAAILLQGSRIHHRVSHGQRVLNAELRSKKRDAFAEVDYRRSVHERDSQKGLLFRPFALYLLVDLIKDYRRRYQLSRVFSFLSIGENMCDVCSSSEALYFRCTLLLFCM
jgi:hypothetical protein